jgi:hypothetical protein
MTMLAKGKAMPTMSLSTQAKTAEVCPFSFLGFRTLGSVNIAYLFHS